MADRQAEREAAAEGAWKCGQAGCKETRGWHARTAEMLLETVGPRGEREFEQEHPDPDHDGLQIGWDYGEP